MSFHYPTVNWAGKAVLYEANIRQYTKQGNFEAFANHLPRLKQMGVDVIWLMPITPISKLKRQGSLGSYYACSSYTTINEEFGSLHDFKNLVTQAHDLGLKVIIDWVANHTGCDHEWTLTNPEFYLKDEEGNFTERNGWVDVIDLNYEVEAMQQAMIEAMQFWIRECNIDGFRCDMAHLVPLTFWHKARQACDALKPLFWLAETDETNYSEVFDVSYAWKLMHASEKYAKYEFTIHDVYNVLHSYSQMPFGAKKLFFTTNHDENSWNGTEYEKYGKTAKAWTVFCFTWHGMPLIYSGQETANYKRLQFFDKDEITWQQPLPLQEFYTTLSNLHKTNAVSKGETFNLPTTQNYVMAYLRKFTNEVVLVLLNLSNHDRVVVEVNHEAFVGEFENVFSGLVFSFNKQEKFELMANEYLVYKLVNS